MLSRTSDNVKKSHMLVRTSDQADLIFNQVDFKRAELEEFSCQVDLIEYQASSKPSE